MADLLINTRFQPLSHLGKPLDGGSVTVYEEDTNKLATIYTDTGEGTAASNPLTLDATAGDANIALTSAQRHSIIIKDSNGVTTHTIDGVEGIAPPGNSEAATDTSSVSTRNLLIGGDFRVNPWQRGTSFTAATTPANNDDTYLADRWVLVSDGNDIVDVSQDTDGSLKCLVATADKQWGFVQLLENKDIEQILSDGVVSLSIEAKSSVGLKLRAAVVAWTSTADSPTSDVIGTWAGNGTNPTFATNYTAENTATDLQTTTDYTTLTVSNITVDTANTTNLAVVVWVDNTTIATNVTLNIKRIQMNLGASATAFEQEKAAKTLKRCQRYYSKSYDQATAPGTASTDEGSVYYRYPGPTSISTSNFGRVALPVSMRTPPSVTLYSTSTGTAAKVRLEADAADITGTTANVGTEAFWINGNEGASGIDTNNTMRVQWAADAEL